MEVYSIELTGANVTNLWFESKTTMALDIIDQKQVMQLEVDFLENLPHVDLLSIATRLLATTKTLYDQLNMNSTNSSMPPSSDTPWSKESVQMDVSNSGREAQPSSKERKKRSCGYGRAQKLPITKTVNLKSDACCNCSYPLSENTASKAYTAYYQLELEQIPHGIGGYEITNTKYILFDSQCGRCNSCTRYKIDQYNTDFDKIKISNWRLIGSTLASLIVFLNKEQGLTIRKIKRLLFELYGIELSCGTITNCVIESGLGVEPITDQLKEDILSSSYLHADETSWPESYKTSWLWVFLTKKTCLFSIGSRAKQTADTILDGFNGWLMSDGYNAYRSYKKRFRCWAHLKRKAKKLSESNWIKASVFGTKTLTLLDALMQGVYEARARGQPDSIKSQYEDKLNDFQNQCEIFKDCGHKKTEDLSKEFLNDWEAIFRILDYPGYPLTNNEAERALRPWVIVRRLAQGTRSPVGSKALATLASIVETCKLRRIGIIGFLKKAISVAKIGQMPMLNVVGVKRGNEDVF
jgi:hypothetical protein